VKTETSVFVDSTFFSGELRSMISLHEVSHSEFDQIEREEPNNVPNPDDTDPRRIDMFNISESPIGKSGNDRRNQLSNDESPHESE